MDQVTAFRELRESYPDWKVAPFGWGMIISPLARRGCYDQAIDVWQEMMEAGVQSDVRLRETMVNLCLESQDTQREHDWKALRRVRTKRHFTRASSSWKGCAISPLGS